MMARSPFGIALLLAALAIPAAADKVIMKDGKIYEGRVIGEATRSVLFRPSHKTPILLPMQDILTIVKENLPEPPLADPDRQLHIEGMLTGAFPSSGQMTVSPAFGLELLAGFRLHPKIQLEAGQSWSPSMSGELAITDGLTLRSYERFQEWSGGFGLRLFPFSRTTRPLWEPSLSGGYRWNRLTAKASGDGLSGSSWNIGVGLAHRLRPWLFWENRLRYERARYNDVDFLGRQGSLTRDITLRRWTVQTGLSWRI